MIAFLIHQLKHVSLVLKHMFWLRNKKNNFPLSTLTCFWRPDHRSLKIDPYIAPIALNQKAHKALCNFNASAL